MEAILMKAASFIAVIILGYGLRKAGFFKEEDFYVIRVSINQEMFIGNKHGYRYEMNNGKFYMERIVLDEEGNIARFLESIIENEGQLIVLEGQYHDFYKYVLLPILSILKSLIKAKKKYQLMMKLKSMEILMIIKQFISNQFMLMKIKIESMDLMIS